MKLVSISILLNLIFSTQLNAETLTFYNWEHYLSPNVISSWEKHSGTKVREIYYDNGEDRDRVIAKSPHTLDMVIINQDSLQMLKKRKTFLNLKKKRKQLNVVGYEKFSIQACGDYSVPYLWGTIGIAYRKDKVTHVPTSWNDLLNPLPEYKGKISWLTEPADAFLPSLLTANKKIDTSSRSALKKAYYQLLSALPNVLTFEYPITYLGNNVQDESLYMGMVYSGDQYTMNEIQNNDVWEYTIPKEGTSLWVDCLAVLSSSKNKKLALEFIEFINRADIAALNSTDVYVATPNPLAKKLQPEDIVEDVTIYPSKSILSKSQSYPYLETKNLRLRKRMLNTLTRKKAQSNKI